MVFLSQDYSVDPFDPLRIEGKLYLSCIKVGKENNA